MSVLTPIVEYVVLTGQNDATAPAKLLMNPKTFDVGTFLFMVVATNVWASGAMDDMHRDRPDATTFVGSPASRSATCGASAEQRLPRKLRTRASSDSVAERATRCTRHSY